MRSSRALGVAAVMAIAGMALWAGGASATQICVPGTPVNPSECPTTNEKEYTTNTDLHGVAQNWTMTSPIATVTCKEASTTMRFSASTGATIGGEVTAFTLTNDCTTSAGTSCTITVVNLPYPASLTSEQITVNDASGAGAKLVCGVLINCTFTTKDAALSIDHDTYQETWQMEKTGGFCPATAEWHATFKIDSPSGATVL